MEIQDSQDFILKGILKMKSKVPLQAVILLLTSEKGGRHTTSVNMFKTGTLLCPQITISFQGSFPYFPVLAKPVILLKFTFLFKLINNKTIFHLVVWVGHGCVNWLMSWHFASFSTQAFGLEHVENEGLH